MDLPSDLVPLPTSPWDERPAEIPLDIEECRTALWLERGNISAAAYRLRITSKRLRAFVRNSKYLTAELEEASEQLVDKAEAIAYEALTDESDPGRQDSMARFIMSGKGRSRGHGTGNSKAPGVNINLGGGRLSIQWENGESINDNETSAKVIDGVANE